MSHRVKSFAIAREHFCIIAHVDIVLKYNHRPVDDDDDDGFHRYSSLPLYSILHSVYLNEQYSVYLLSEEKRREEEEEHERGAGVLSLTDPFINRRLGTHRTCRISRDLPFMSRYSRLCAFYLTDGECIDEEKTEELSD